MDTFKEQQSDYRSQSEGINSVYQKLKDIQMELEVMSNSSVGNNSLSNSEISAIPDELKHRVNELRKNLVETKSKQNGYVPSNGNQKSEEQ